MAGKKPVCYPGLRLVCTAGLAAIRGSSAGVTRPCLQQLSSSIPELACCCAWSVGMSLFYQYGLTTSVFCFLFSVFRISGDKPSFQTKMIPNSEHVPPLWLLCQDGNTPAEAVSHALAMGQDVNETGDELNMTGLMLALMCRNHSVVEVLLQQSSLDINRIAATGLTALHLVCCQGDVTGLRMLLRDPRLTLFNARSRGGLTPLMLAVSLGRTECVKEMVRIEEVDLETRDDDWKSLEAVARWVEQSITIQLLISHILNNSTLKTSIFQ